MTTPVTAGNPDEIWILRKGQQLARCFYISRLHAADPPVNSVNDFTVYLQKEFIGYRDVDSDQIYIQKFGEDGISPPDIPITAFGGNTAGTPHPVWTKVGFLAGIFNRYTSIAILLVAFAALICAITFAAERNWTPAGFAFAGAIALIGMLYSKHVNEQ